MTIRECLAWSPISPLKGGQHADLRYGSIGHDSRRHRMCGGAQFITERRNGIQDRGRTAVATFGCNVPFPAQARPGRRLRPCWRDESKQSKLLARNRKSCTGVAATRAIACPIHGLLGASQLGPGLELGLFSDPASRERPDRRRFVGCSAWPAGARLLSGRAWAATLPEPGSVTLRAVAVELSPPFAHIARTAVLVISLRRR